MPRTTITRKMIVTMRKRKNRNLAMPAAPALMPVKPKTPATSEMIAKMTSLRRCEIFAGGPHAVFGPPFGLKKS